METVTMAGGMATADTTTPITTATDDVNNSLTVNRKNFRKSGDELMPSVEKLRLKGIRHQLHDRNTARQDSHRARINARRQNVNLDAGICAFRVGLAV